MVTFPPAFEAEVGKLRETLGDGVPPFLVRRLLLDVGGHVEHHFADAGLLTRVKEARQRLAQAGCPVPAVEARVRYGWIRVKL